MADHALEQDTDLPAPGHRWGTGARSVLPYLTKSLQAKPAASTDARDGRLREAEPVRRDDAPSRAP
jgi:hypothetical protein